MRTEDFRPQASMGITNSISLQIQLLEEEGDTYVYSSFVSGENQSEVTRARVRYNSHGKPYFHKNRKRHYLSEFMKNSL